MKRVYIVNTGIANIASVSAAFARLDTTPIVTENINDIRYAEYLVLPGVGNFGASIKILRESNLIEAIKDRINSGLPTLSICLGFQILAQNSEEDSSCCGLGLIKSDVVKLKATMPIPQIGWNKVIPDNTCSLIKPGFVYFANSFAYADVDSSWSKSFFNYENRYIAAVEKEKILACQFHPELSGNYGKELLNRWLEKGAAQ